MEDEEPGVLELLVLHLFREDHGDDPHPYITLLDGRRPIHDGTMLSQQEVADLLRGSVRRGPVQA